MTFFTRIAVILVLLSITSLSSAQSRVVSGSVVSDLGNVVSGVTIFVVNGKARTISDSNGQFALTVDGSDTVLRFEMEGYTARDIVVGTNRNLEVELFLEDLWALSLEDLMNTVISSSSFFGLKSKDTPGFVYTQNLDELLTPRTLASISRMVLPGVSDGGHRDSEVIGVRGMKVVDNSKTLVMFDGQSLNQRANMGYSLGFSSPLLGDVKRIEMGLSPNAIVHGSGAINGYINMIPRNGFDDAGVMVRAVNDYTEQSFGESFFNLVEMGYGIGSSQRNAYFYAGWYQHPGFTPDSSLAISPVSTVRIDGSNLNLAENLDQTLVGNTYLPNIRLSTHVNYDGFNFNSGYQQIYRSTNLNMQQNFQRILNIRPKYSLNITDSESVDLIAGAEFFDLGVINSSVPERPSFGGRERHVQGKFVVKSSRFLNNSLAFGALIGNRSFEMQKQYFGSDLDDAGLQYYIDPFTGRNNAEGLYWASGQIPDGEWREMAVFVENIYEVNAQWTVSGGLRYDNYYIRDISESFQNIAPRVATSYVFSGNSVLKASYQQGFRTIDLYHLYQTKYNRLPQINHANSSGNGNLETPLAEDYNTNRDLFTVDIKPEQLESFELSYYYSILDRRLTFDVNGYFNIYKNTIDYLPLVRWSTADFLADESYRGEIIHPGKYFSDEALYNWTRPGSNDRQRENYTNERGIAINSTQDIKMAGGEFIVNFRPMHGSFVRVIYGYAKSLNDAYQDNSTFPLHQIKLAAGYSLLNERVLVSSNFLYEPGIIDNETSRNNYHDIYFTDRTLLDLSVKYNFTNSFSMAASAFNLLGENNPGLLFKPVSVENESNTSTEYLGLGRNVRSFMVTLTVKL